MLLITFDFVVTLTHACTKPSTRLIVLQGSHFLQQAIILYPLVFLDETACVANCVVDYCVSQNLLCASKPCGCLMGSLEVLHDKSKAR